MFEKLNETYTAVELDNRDDANEIQDVLLEITGGRTVITEFLSDDTIWLEFIF